MLCHSLKFFWYSNEPDVEKVAETETSCSMLTLSYNFFVHTWETCQIETFNLNAQNQGKNITLHCNLQTSTKRH